MSSVEMMPMRKPPRTPDVLENMLVFLLLFSTYEVVRYAVIIWIIG